MRYFLFVILLKCVQSLISVGARFTSKPSQAGQLLHYKINIPNTLTVSYNRAWWETGNK